MFDDIEDESETKKKKDFPSTYYNSLGDRYYYLLQLQKAQSAYERVLESDSKNTRALLGRLKCLSRQSRFEEAVEVAEKLLRVNPQHSEGVAMKAQCSYMVGDFEKSFLTCWSEFKKRPKVERCRVGFQASEKAIEDTLCPDGSLLKFDKEEVGDMEELLMGKRETDTEDSEDDGLFMSDRNAEEDRKSKEESDSSDDSVQSKTKDGKDKEEKLSGQKKVSFDSDESSVQSDTKDEEDTEEKLSGMEKTDDPTKQSDTKDGKKKSSSKEETAKTDQKDKDMDKPSKKKDLEDKREPTKKSYKKSGRFLKHDFDKDYIMMEVLLSDKSSKSVHPVCREMMDFLNERIFLKRMQRPAIVPDI